VTISLQQAAEHLGVHYQTAYRWVREGLLPAQKVGTAYVVAETDLRALETSRAQARPAPATIRVRGWDGHAERLHAALLAGDERAALAVVSRLRDGGAPVLDVVERLIVPAMRHIGAGWPTGAVSIAQEHRASAACARLLADLSRPVPGRPRGTAVVTTPAGEQHALPALMAATALRAAHWRVHHLGADMPADDLAVFAREVGAHVVVLSVTHTDASGPAEQAAQTLGNRNLDVLVGRPGATLRELVERANRLGR